MNTFNRIWIAVSLALFQAHAWAAVNQPTTPPASMNEDPARVMGYGLLSAVLVTMLLVGGILVVNLGLLSKRPSDRIGGRSPSDLGILKDNAWTSDRTEPSEEHLEEPSLEDLERVRERRRARMESDVKHAKQPAPGRYKDAG